MWGRSDSQEVGLEAAILERVRNSSLVECPRADNGSGLKLRTETVDSTSNEQRGTREAGTKATSFCASGAPRHSSLGCGRGAFGRGEGRPGRAPGVLRSANAGMSSD